MATCKGDRAAHAQLGGEGGGGAAKADAQGQGGAQDKAPPAITEPPRAAETTRPREVPSMCRDPVHPDRRTQPPDPTAGGGTFPGPPD